MRVGKPEGEGYQVYAVDDYQVHLFKDVRVGPEVVVNAPGFGIFRSLRVSGVYL